ncbi:MAG: glycerophosphodiester phosphodiesterase [Dehalococcoidia bacterium]|nr:glycerophosphodiester phosphodiesterase [Dehalococcoidia bacterium]
MHKTVVIAHRGFHRDYPENTLEAFKAALDLGVDGVEFDVQETADGEFIVHHDEDISGRSIGSLSLADVAGCRVAGGYRVPTLQEALNILGKGLVLLVELKQVRSLEKFLAILRRYVDKAWTVLVSFDAALIERLAVLAPELPRAVISEPKDSAVAIATAGTAGFTQLAAGMVTGDLVEKAHARGDLVFVWDGGDQATMRRALLCSPDVIMTDRPDIVIREMRKL